MKYRESLKSFKSLTPILDSTLKELEGYTFSSEKNQYKPLIRDTLTKEINLVERLENKPNLTSHSFRISFISQLWRNTGDIEFVRQAIGHSKLESTSSYVENLSDEDRRLRMEQITPPVIQQIEKFIR